MEAKALRVGFVPLIDAAPLIVAERLGYFRDEALNVSLHRQVGWANVRDKLSFGELDVSHALLGMPLSSHLGRDGFSQPLTTLMELGVGGNAITVRKELHDLGVRSASELATVLNSHPRFSRGQLIVGHVFNSSMHHYLLREWLASADVDPDRDVKLCVIPPPQMAEHMRGKYVDLFCVGEPWNTLATREGYGVAIVATSDILPNHPEKVLAVTQRFAVHQREALTPLIRSVLRACLWCHHVENRSALAEMLARPEYLALPIDLVMQSLSIDRTFGTHHQQKNSRPSGWHLRSFAPADTFPNKMHPVWMMHQMMRWGHLHSEADVAAISKQCADTGPYREAASSLGISCPDADFVPMELRHGRTFSMDNLKNSSRDAAPPASRIQKSNALIRKGAHVT